ncbi:MAG: flavin-containing monooxygenase [Candidatus Pristimantibacillus sp.]
MTIVTDVLVIGGGQAGLATGYYLAQAGIDFIILDSGSRIGDSWRNRYDSLVLFTPKGYSELPGMSFPGDPEQFPNKNETANYLESYASIFQFPIHLLTRVKDVRKSNEEFQITTNKESYTARRVVIASGPFQKEWIPDFANDLPSQINQLHSSKYHNPEQLLSGDTLVVGAGNSGAQIAVELSKSRPVYLSTGHKPISLPLKIGGKSIFYWFDKLGILHATKNSFIGRKIQKRPDPIFGLELKEQINYSAVLLYPKVTGTDRNSVIFADGSHREFMNIIWGTGFRFDYNWLKIPHIFDLKGGIIHDRGITPEYGLYIVGMPWQYRRTSALLGGVGEDSRYIVESIINNV